MPGTGSAGTVIEVEVKQTGHYNDFAGNDENVAHICAANN